METNGDQWDLMETNGTQWKPMGPNRNQWGQGPTWGSRGGPVGGSPPPKAHHDGGQLHEGEAAVELRLSVFDDADVGGREGGEWGQGGQDGLQAALRVEVAEDDGCGAEGEDVCGAGPIDGPQRASRTHRLTPKWTRDP